MQLRRGGMKCRLRATSLLSLTSVRAHGFPGRLAVCARARAARVRLDIAAGHARRAGFVPSSSAYPPGTVEELTYRPIERGQSPPHAWGRAGSGRGCRSFRARAPRPGRFNCSRSLVPRGRASRSALTRLCRNEESMNSASLTSITTRSFVATSSVSNLPSDSLVARSCSPVHSTTTAPGRGFAPCDRNCWETPRALEEAANGLTERRRSRTDRAWGYHTAQVLKTCWATGPMPLREGGYRGAGRDGLRLEVPTRAVSNESDLHVRVGRSMIASTARWTLPWMWSGPIVSATPSAWSTASTCGFSACEAELDALGVEELVDLGRALPSPESRRS